MEGFSVTIEIPSLAPNYIATFNTQIHLCMQAAARKFLLILATRFPVRTGFLRGSLTPLENILGAVQSQGPGRAPQVRRGRRPAVKEKILLREYYYPPGGTRVLKTTRSGIPFATPEREIFESATIVKASTGRLLFRYKIDITYLRINDNFAGSRGRPWNAYKDAIDAFTAEFKAQFPHYLPTLDKFVIKKRFILTGPTWKTQQETWKG